MAAWPNAESVPPSPSASQRFDQRLVAVLYPAGVRAIDAGFAELAALHPAEPHRYLAFIGVDPAAQARGVGSALLAPALAAADAEGVACYLETPFPRTIPFYRRLGFEVERELPHTFGLGPLWTMRRRARPHRRRRALHASGVLIRPS